MLDSNQSIIRHTDGDTDIRKLIPRTFRLLVVTNVSGEMVCDYFLSLQFWLGLQSGLQS